MKQLFIYSICVLMLCSCGQRTAIRAQYEIVLDRFAANPKEININEIAAHIDYIQLETTSESLIMRIHKIEIKDNRIYVLDFENASLLVFDLAGKFIRQIGRRGQAPGEYIGIEHFALSDSVILITDQMRSTMILYDTLGRFITQKRYYPINPRKVAFLKGMPIFQLNFPDLAYNNGYRISFLDRNLDIVASLLKSDYSLDEATADKLIGHSLSTFAYVDDSWTLWERGEDIVYKIIDENTIIKRYEFRYKNPAKYEDVMFNIEDNVN
jgi:hypothetical protein